MTRTLLTTSSQKGGVGKTMFAAALLDTLRQSGQRVDGYDADGAIGGLIDLHGSRTSDGHLQDPQDPSQGVVPYDIRDADSRGLLINCLETDARVMLHDLAGGALGALCMLFGDDPATGLIGLDQTLDDLDVNMTILHLVNRDEGSVVSVGQYLDLTTPCRRIGHVAVINRHRAREADLWAWLGTADGQHGGRTRERLLDRGGREMSLPALDDGAAALALAASVPFSVASQHRDLPLIQRQRIRQFLRAFDAELTPEIRATLGVGG